MDFPASPAVGQIYTQAGGAPSYVWQGNAWVSVGQLGVVKISSGAPAVAALFDIPFPDAAGYPGGFELLLSNVAPQAATDTVVMRHSNDGSTFGSASQYRYAATTGNDSAAAPVTIGSTAQTYIALTGTIANTAGFKSGFRLFYPFTADNASQNVLWDGWYFNGTNIVKINGIGLNTTIAGQSMPKAVRILTNSGSNFQQNIRWQLNGFR